MSSRYITFPIPVDAQDLMQLAFNYIKTKNPSWEPSEGQLDTWLIEATSSEAADIGTLASQVDKTIFKFIGTNLFGIPNIAATASTATINITAVDTLGHTIAAGTQVGIRDVAGNLVAFYLVNDAVIPAASSTVNGVLIASSLEGAFTAGLGSVGGNVELIDTNQYILSIAQATVSTGGVDEEDSDAYITRLALELQTMAPRPILPRDFEIISRDVAGVQRTLVVDGYNPALNIATADQSSFETGTGTMVGSNCAVAQTAAQAADGTKSLSLTASSAADMSCAWSPGSAPLIYANPNATYSAYVQFRAAATPRSCKVGIRWLDAGLSVIRTDYSGLVTDTTTGWTAAVALSIGPPANAVRAEVVAYVVSPASAEVHYIDKVQLSNFYNTTWTLGPGIGTNQEKTIAFYALDANGAPIGYNTKLALQTYLDAKREINFIVAPDDATVNLIDVNVSYIVLPQYSLSDVQSRVITAIQTYLDPRYWGIAPDDDPNNPSTFRQVTKVYLYEMASVINNVAGVDRITALTQGIHGGSITAADVNLVGNAPLTTASTISATGSY